MLFDNIVITEDEFLQPSYRISPFRTEHISLTINQHKLENVDRYFSIRFGQSQYVYTSSGRNAINKALHELNLNKKDVISIFTTTDNFYISGCVTKIIEQHCKWSRKIEKNTKAIFVNHEFGFPYENLNEIKKYNLPIIEDCAHSFLSNNKEKSVGTIGEYVIYSLPKFFPIQFGGILKNNTNKRLRQDITKEEETYMKGVISYYIDILDDIRLKRSYNYNYLESQLLELGFKPRFVLEDDYCPGVYMFKTNNVNLNKMKQFLQKHGVECSVFYGEESFFIPVNQSLNLGDLNYMVTLIRYFLKKEEE